MGKQQSQTATKGVAFNLNPFPASWSREGYDFKGWALSPNATEVQYRDEQEVTFWDSIVRLYAVWQANETPSGETYRVTFNGNGGSVVGNSSRNVTSGSEIGELPTATRTGYTFAGWYTTSATSGGTQITSNTTISSVTTFFARWNIIEYDIIYDLNGYDGTMPASAVTKYTVESGNITPPAPIPNSDNQAFQNWEPSSIAAGSTGNVTFRAIWNGESSVTNTRLYWSDNPGDYTIVEARSDGALTEDIINSCLEEQQKSRSDIVKAEIGTDVTRIRESALSRCTSMTSVTIPGSVTSIGSDAFYGCSGLTSVTIPDSVTSIAASAFKGCSNLTSVTIGNGVRSIPDTAFWKCSSLASVTIPNSVISIGEAAFYNCGSLTSVTIPNSVTSIGDHAFWFCDGLTSVIFEGNAPEMGTSVFSGVASGCTAYVHRNTTGWSNQIPGTWNGIDIAYRDESEDLVEEQVTFNANGGVFSDQTTIKLMGVSEGARVRNIKPENPTLSGYVFNGWWTTPNKAVGSHNVSQGRQVYDWELCNTDKTYYAAWSKPCQITFNANGGMFNGSDTSRVITVDSNVQFDKAFQLMEDPLRTGYAFGWWYDDEACEHIRYRPWGIIDKDNEVYAGWTELDDTMCTVTLDAGDGVFEGSEKQKTLIVNKGSLFRTIKPEDPIRSGYNFNKWWTAPSIYAGNPISSPWSKIESDITLYANYTVATQITFNANGGTFGGTETTKVISADLYTEYYNILPDDPVRNGYIFDGWYWPSTSSSSTLIDPEGKASGDRTWVARWTQL